MGLLDSDAEELKRNKSGENSSGRKVNQSGLGALKGLSKYSNLTAKYRTTGKSENPSEAESVEHLRGTHSKSVRSQCEVSAGIHTPQKSFETIEVSAKSVQSQCMLSASSVIIVEAEIDTKSVQSQCNQGDRPSTNELIEEPIIQLSDINEVSAKSVRELTSSPNVRVNLIQNSSVDVSFKSTQSQCVDEAFVGEINSADIIVSAKSVQNKDLHMDLESSSDVSFDAFSTSQSRCEVGAEEELRFESSSIKETIKVENFPPAKSVQSQGEVRAFELKLGSGTDKIKVSAKSVQQKVEVSAKPVQSQGRVGAIRIDDEVVNSSKSKVLAKNLEAAEPMESIISISGSQRVIVDFLFQLCLWNNSLITPPITKQQLTSETGLLEETALSSIKRLRKKNIIDRYAYKDGKAGWTQYQFSESSYKELLHLRQVGAKSVQRPPTEIERGISSSSLIGGKRGINNFVSNGTKQGLSEQGWFKNLDFSKIYPIGPMVVNPAIRSLIEEKLSPDLVQDFINRFTSWTSTQGRITSPIGLFCDKLKELAREGDSPVFGCMTEEERQAEAAFAAHVEKAKAEMELIRKARSESVEKEADSAFENWYTSSNDSEKFELAEPSSFAPSESEAYRRILKAAYLEKINLKG